MQGGADIVCQECGRQNSPDARFCDNCGTRIDGACQSCGHQNGPGARFCNNCGQILSGGAAQAAAPSAPASDASVCPRCLHRNDEGAQFCYSCGLPLTGENAKAAPHAIRAFQHGPPGGFWARVAAYIIDGIVLTVLGIAVYPLTGESPLRCFDTDSSLVFADVLVIVIQLLYTPILISLWSTTIGKRALNLYVLRSDGSRCGFWQAFGRTLASTLSALLFGIGFLMVALRQDKRALHDLIAGTAVIQRS